MIEPRWIVSAQGVVGSLQAVEAFSDSLVHGEAEPDGVYSPAELRSRDPPPPCLPLRMSAADAPTPFTSTSDVSFVGRRVGKYEIVRLIARGGMGTVYEAINKDIGKRVAMKFVDAELARNKDSVARFQREAEAASAVESGHIVTIFDSGMTDDGLPFLVMELCRGEDLGHHLRKVGRMEPDGALDVTAQLLRGLHRAHEAGIVHRDLKPDNIFLTEQDDGSTFVKILDFGISKMRRGVGAIDKTITKQGTVLGTPFYMSPEQAQALPDVDERTDLWSTGAILYEVLTGRPPHDGHSYEQVIVHICTKDTLDARVHNPGVPEKLASFLTKALCRDREVRFQNAREMLDALGEASEGLLSPRALRVSSGRDTSTSKQSSGTTPNPHREPDLLVATAPTVDVGTGGPSRVGWSTSSGTTGQTERRRIALGALAVVAVALAGVAIAIREPAAKNPAPASMSTDQPRPVATTPNESATTNPAPPPTPTASVSEIAPVVPERKPAKASAVSKSAPSGRDKPVEIAELPPIPKTTTKTAPATTATAEPKPTATNTSVAPKLKLKVE